MGLTNKLLVEVDILNAKVISLKNRAKALEKTLNAFDILAECSDRVGRANMRAVTAERKLKRATAAIHMAHDIFWMSYDDEEVAESLKEVLEEIK